LIAGLLPLVAMFGAFAIGVAWDVLPPCNPIIDGCRSISATGRQPPGSFLFRLIMLPQSALLWFTWYLSVRWLDVIPPGIGRGRRSAILVAALVNAVALAVYVTFLGSSEPIYEFMRRFGIYFGFLGMAVAQLLVGLSMLRTDLGSVARLMLGLSLAVLLLGLLNLVLKSVLADADPSENRIEWIAAILMQGWFFLLFVAWRKSAVDFQVRAGRP